MSLPTDLSSQTLFTTLFNEYDKLYIFNSLNVGTYVWNFSKKTKHKFSCWVELMLCELKKVEVPHRMKHTH